MLVTVNGATQVLGTPPASYGIGGLLDTAAIEKLREALRRRSFDDEAARRAEVSVQITRIDPASPRLVLRQMRLDHRPLRIAKPEQRTHDRLHCPSGLKPWLTGLEAVSCEELTPSAV